MLPRRQTTGVMVRSDQKGRRDRVFGCTWRCWWLCRTCRDRSRTKVPVARFPKSKKNCGGPTVHIVLGNLALNGRSNLCNVVSQIASSRRHQPEEEISLYLSLPAVQGYGRILRQVPPAQTFCAAREPARPGIKWPWYLVAPFVITAMYQNAITFCARSGYRRHALVSRLDGALFSSSNL